jgi:hypothetical protein
MINLKQAAAYLLAAVVPVLAAASCAEQPTSVTPGGDSPDRARDDLSPVAGHVRAGDAANMQFSASATGSRGDSVPMELGLCPVPPDCN